MTKIMVVNAQAASAPVGKTNSIVKKALAEAYAADVDVIAWCEVNGTDVGAIAERRPCCMSTRQPGNPIKDEPETNLAFSWDPIYVTLKDFERTVGSKETQEGKWKTGMGIRERGIFSATLDAGLFDVPINVIHPPPLRAPIARAAYMSRALKKGGIVLGDTNFVFSALNRMRLRRRRRVVSVGLLAIFVPKRLWVSKPKRVDVGSDHLAFIVTIEPKRTRRQRRRKKRSTT